MDWARDQLGDLVHASQRGLLSYGLSCPTCGEPVRRRAGTHRRPHFAHYSYSAKPECENYHPSLHTPAMSGARHFGRDEQAAPSRPSLQGGLFLESAGQGNYSLYLKLPQLSAETAAAGAIEIRSGLGTRTYTASQLQRPRFVPVVPRLPLAEVIAVPELAAIEAAIRAQLERFRSADNYFRASEVGGRLLASEEPLEWGERYWLLTQQTLGRVPEGLGLEMESDVERQGWHLYEFALPAFAHMGSESRIESLAGYLGRTIRSPRVRAYFIDPPPHHIEPDGTHVFPETTERIVLRRTGHSGLSVQGDPQAVSSAIVRDLADEWVEITGIGPGDFTVLLDGREELLGRVAECGLFQPRGVRVAVGDRIWELFEPELREVIQQGLPECVRIECPSQRVADRLGLASEVWAREGTCFNLYGVPHDPVDAENFGTLTWPVSEEAGTEPPVADAETRARRIWLEGLVARLYGSDMLMQLRKEWNEASRAHNSNSAVRELAWLRPYIQLARSG